MYRPQFQFGTPPGYVDVPYVRALAVGQDPSFVVPPGEVLLNYVLQLDADAPTLFRSLFVQGALQGQDNDIQLRIRDAFGNYLTDGFVSVSLFAWGAGKSPDSGSGRCKIWEPELYCPAGSVLMIDFFNPGPNAISFGG